MDWKIETWDVGYYQMRNAMKELGGGVSSRADAASGDSRPPAENLREAAWADDWIGKGQGAEEGTTGGKWRNPL